MNALRTALAQALADVVQDHWTVALALHGVDVPAPHDEELAALVATVRQDGDRDLASLAVLHPEAVRRQVEWALDASLRNPEVLLRDVIDLDAPVSIAA